MPAKPPDLQRIAAKWKDRLGLAHWSISIRYAAPEDMSDEDNMGEVEWDMVRRTAAIKICHPDYASKFKHYHIESIVVHELIHCVLACLTRAIESEEERHIYVALEHAVDDLASALLLTQAAK